MKMPDSANNQARRKKSQIKICFSGKVNENETNSRPLSTDASNSCINCAKSENPTARDAQSHILEHERGCQEMQSRIGTRVDPIDLTEDETVNNSRLHAESIVPQRLINANPFSNPSDDNCEIASGNDVTETEKQQHDKIVKKTVQRNSINQNSSALIYHENTNSSRKETGFRRDPLKRRNKPEDIKIKSIKVSDDEPANVMEEALDACCEGACLIDLTIPKIEEPANESLHLPATERRRTNGIQRKRSFTELNVDNGTEELDETIQKDEELVKTSCCMSVSPMIYDLLSSDSDDDGPNKNDMLRDQERPANDATSIFDEPRCEVSYLSPSPPDCAGPAAALLEKKQHHDASNPIFKPIDATCAIQFKHNRLVPVNSIDTPACEKAYQDTNASNCVLADLGTNSEKIRGPMLEHDNAMSNIPHSPLQNNANLLSANTKAVSQPNEEDQTLCRISENAESLPLVEPLVPLDYDKGMEASTDSVQNSSSKSYLLYQHSKFDSPQYQHREWQGGWSLSPIVQSKMDPMNSFKTLHSCDLISQCSPTEFQQQYNCSFPPLACGNPYQPYALQGNSLCYQQFQHYQQYQYTNTWYTVATHSEQHSWQQNYTNSLLNGVQHTNGNSNARVPPTNHQETLQVAAQMQAAGLVVQSDPCEVFSPPRSRLRVGEDGGTGDQTIHDTKSAGFAKKGDRSRNFSPRRNRLRDRDEEVAADPSMHDMKALFLSPIENLFSSRKKNVDMKQNTVQGCSQMLKSNSGLDDDSPSSLDVDCDFLSVTRQLNSKRGGVVQEAQNSTIKYCLPYEDKNALKDWKPYLLPQKKPSDQNPSLPPCMTSVDHLSRMKFTQDGLPIWHFTVYGGDDDILYYFKAFAQESLIPGAGYGAFLTFLGAKKLKRQSKVLNDALMSNTDVLPHLEPKPLQAIPEEGKCGVTVHLKGAGYDKHGRQYKSMTNLEAIIDQRIVRPGSLLTGGRQLVRIFGAGLPSDIVKKAYYVSNPYLRIGHLGIHMESDYKWDAQLRFPALAECVDLGRYGPFRVEDRKTDELFCLKDFIFASEPAEWGFDVAEELGGSLQIIDITDDSTGKPHEIAKSFIPMYVNEVGYNPKYKQNVFNCDESDRVVKYFFRPNHSLKQGDTVELLTNYRDSYERSRERKGYGWRNLYEGQCGDSCLPQRLQRNFVDRRDVEFIVDGVTSLQVLSTWLNFLHHKVWIPMIARINEFLSDSNSQAFLTSNEWIGAIRMQWLMNLFRQKISGYKDSPTRENLLNQLLVHNMMQTVDAIQLGALELQVLNDREIVDDMGKSVNEAVRNEIIEEIGFYVQGDLPMLLDCSVYCPIAVRLINKLILILANSIPLKKKLQDEELIGKKLWEDFCELAVVAAKETRAAVDAFDGNSRDSELNFSSGLKLKASLTGPIQKALELFKFSSASFLDNCTMPKGFRAALLDKTAYLDALLLSGIEPQVDTSTISFDVPEAVVMVKFTQFSTNDELLDLSSAPRSVSSVLTTSKTINSTWYIIWQVFWPVYVFSTKFLDSSMYSVENLCARLEINTVLASFASKHGMRRGVNEELKFEKLIMQLMKTKHSYNQRNQKTSINHSPARETIKTPRPSALPVYEGKVKAFPEEYCSEGWTQKTYKRQSGTSARQLDSYWYTPLKQYKLRSMVEIRRFMVALAIHNGDETLAFRAVSRR